MSTEFALNGVEKCVIYMKANDGKQHEEEKQDKISYDCFSQWISGNVMYRNDLMRHDA